MEDPQGRFGQAWRCGSPSGEEVRPHGAQQGCLGPSCLCSPPLTHPVPQLLRRLPSCHRGFLACITDWAFKEFFKLLGWDLKGGEKDLEFSQKFEVLGVTLDVGEVLDCGRAVVDNSEKRKQGVVDQIAAILRSSTLSSAEAEQLCGRLGFAASQLFARIGSAAIWHLRRKADLHEGPAPLTGPLATSLEDWAKAVVSQAPRSIFLEPRGQVVVCCSDGFLDGEGSTLRAGVGANIADRETGTFEAFGVMLPPTVLRKLCAAAGSERVIAEVESLAVLAVEKFWRAHLGKWAGR